MIKTNCPRCGYEFDLNDEISKEVNQKVEENDLLKKQLEEIEQSKNKENDLLKKQLEEIEQYKNKENDLLKKQLEDIGNARVSERATLRKSLEDDIRSEMESKIVLEMKCKFDEAKEHIADEFKEKEEKQEQRHKEEIKAFEMQIEKMKDATRKASDVAYNTPNDIKGKIGEDNVGILIRDRLPYDRIEKIGTRGGGDFIHTVIEGNHKCGKILYECKNAEKFNRSEWIPKIREDSLRDNCDRMVIVTKVMPVGLDDQGKDIRKERIDPCRIDGVWICTYDSIEGVICLLRDGLVHQDIANVSQFDRSSKKEELYEYVVSNEFMSEENDFRDILVKRRTHLEDYLKRTVRSIKVQIDEAEEQIIKFDHIFSRINDITGKCAETEIVEDDIDEIISTINNSRGQKRKGRERGQATIMDGGW